MSDADEVCIAAPIYLELCLAAVGRRGQTAVQDINDQIMTLGARIVPFEQKAAREAVRAFLRYGKGQNHPAQLNFGDCISYAVSKVEAMPLFFKGDDFRHTDVEAAL